MKAVRVLCGFFWGFVAPVFAAEPVILVTIKPLAWMVQALAPAGADVQVLVPDNISPHEYQLRPADALRVKNSALLVWVGPGMEPWLVQLAQQQSAAKNSALLPNALHIENEDHAHDHNAQDDPHIWLDPLALKDHADAVAERLVQLFPAEAKNIQQRKTIFAQQMTTLDAELAARFAPVAAQGFVVYHDGYQRLVQRYHLNQRAAVWHHESIAGGVRDRAKLLQLLHSGEVRCLFYEPEHGADVVNNWLGKTAQNVKMVEIDPMGTSANNYADFMRGLSGKMIDCLSRR
ncbi:MAG TPA: zinc ABC transporter substrate-binding protein [Pseudomonadales bacterium]|jgi:zinc transport system substrate-binding protein|nr:zinc ABC transporter substrate-binding protein [Pseudomonadales bacterium]HNN86131.1 zinc ABC transporter substrate-binding protein [Pseudomonadales bacterium]